MTCPSDKSIKESIYNSRIEAINNFFVNHDADNFDIVIPLSFPTPIPIIKSIRRMTPTTQEKPTIPKPITPIKVVFDTEWGNKPIPDCTIEFKYGMKWVIITPPYQKENIYYLTYPLPGTSKFASGRGSASKTIQILTGTLDHEIFIDLGWSNAHIYNDGQELKIDFSGGQKASNKRWLEKKEGNRQEEIKQIGNFLLNIVSRCRRLVGKH